VSPQALHVTVAFLGWREPADVDPVAAALRELPLPETPLLTPLRVRALPPRRTRLFALDLEDEAGRGGSLAAAVSARLEAGGWYEPEDRPWWPHVTLARVRRGERAAPWPDLPAPPRAPFRAAALTLYRSTLRREGAEYDALARREL